MRQITARSGRSNSFLWSGVKVQVSTAIRDTSPISWRSSERAAASISPVFNRIHKRRRPLQASVAIRMTSLRCSRSGWNRVLSNLRQCVVKPAPAPEGGTADAQLTSCLGVVASAPF